MAHCGARYVQHNPMIRKGVEGFRSFVKDLKEQFPKVGGDIKRVFADGDFVILHVHAKREPEEAGIAIVDIFRLEGGKIVERTSGRALADPEELGERQRHVLGRHPCAGCQVHRPGRGYDLFGQ